MILLFKVGVCVCRRGKKDQKVRRTSRKEFTTIWPGRLMDSVISKPHWKSHHTSVLEGSVTHRKQYLFVLPLKGS